MKERPEIRDGVAAILSYQLRSEYRQLFTILGLSEAESDSFVQIMAKGSGRMIAGYVLSLEEEAAPPVRVFDELKLLLGEEQFQKYREFHYDKPARDIADQIVRSTYFTSTPLAGEGVRQIQDVVLGALRDPSIGPRYRGNWLQMPLPVWEAIVDRAKGSLSEPQLIALRDMFAQAASHQANSEAQQLFRKAEKQ
jgi:hypothetical protein